MAESQIAHGPTLAASHVAATGDRLATGTIVADYVVDKFLGAGAMGEVYAGHHPVIGKRVAIKLLKRELATDPEAAERFLREAQAVNQIDHPNVIDVFNFGRLASDGRLFLVMDLVDGRSLRKALEDGALDVTTALAVLAKIADALDAAHARGIVHRDLKPDNVMLGAADQVFVLDFGIAKLVSTGTETLTAKGTWLGTPGYMAPEQWSADGAGPASDRYALGVMAYELLAGALPFQAPTLPQMMEQHFRAPVPALSMRGKAVSHHETLDPVLARAMAKSPGDRFDTARELVEALRAAATGVAVVAAVRAHKRSVVVPAVAGVGVLGLAIVGFVMIRGGDDDREPPRLAAAPVVPAIAADFARVEITTSPKDAVVWREGHRVGLTPIVAELRPGSDTVLAIAKPGYRTIRETVAGTRLVAGTMISVVTVLEPITAFEGVWQNASDGQLRGFKRVGDRVEVSKHATITGAGEPWRQLAFDSPPADRPELVVFAAVADLTDARGRGDPSCTIPHRIEYRFDPRAETLEVAAEAVDTVFAAGRCTVRSRSPGEPVAMTRVDRESGDVRHTQPPIGKPVVSNRAPNPAPKPPIARPVQAIDTPQNNSVGDPQVVPQQPAPSPQPQAQQQQVPRGDSQQANPPIQKN
ncbi:MAG: serine/threonine-protein kinase [Kofleriaceae bacterium]